MLGLEGMYSTHSETKRLADAVAGIAATMVEIINEKVKAATEALAAAQPGSSPNAATLTASEGWVKKKEAAQHCKISLRTLHSWMRKGLIPYVRTGPRNIRFKLSAVDEALNRRFQRDVRW